MISICPPVVKDSARAARFTFDPTAPYFVRRSDPMFPTMTRPVWMPIPISSCTLFCAASRSLTSAMAVTLAPRGSWSGVRVWQVTSGPAATREAPQRANVASALAWGRNRR